MSEKVYCVIWEDRHVDTDVYLFYTKLDAVNFADEIIRDNARNADYIDVCISVDSNNPEIIYGAYYNSEGDGVMVVEREVNAEVNNEQ